MEGRMRSWPASLVSILCTGLLAQAPPSRGGGSEEKVLEDLMELLNTPVSTASKRAERTIDSPGVLSLVTREQIRAQGWEQLDEVLLSLPGFGPSRDYDRRTISSRGLFEGWNNNHLLHLVDGIPMNDNIYGTAYTWDISPLFLVRSVEVVRGPGSALYGSNATNGVVQVRTVGVDDLGGGGTALVRLGQYGERRLEAVTARKGDLASLVAGFSTFRTDGTGSVSRDGSLRPGAGGPLASFPVQEGRNTDYLWFKVEGAQSLTGWSLQYHRQAWDYQTGLGWLWQVPDQPEQLRESRDIAALGYQGDLPAGWKQEYLVRLQRHDLRWNLRFYPADTVGFPQGLNEYLDTGARDVFARGQWSLDLPKDSGLLMGVEATRFEYGGDRAHTSNADLSAGTAYPDGLTRTQGPWLAWIKDHPMMSTGLFAQYSSGAVLGDRVKAVVGLRSDRTVLDFTDPATGEAGSRTFSQASPRVALVIKPAVDMAIKVMWGRAFRSPAPSELAGANTYTLASNLRDLQPETLDTAEVALDWILNSHVNWRTNVFRTRFNDQIAYSAANKNLSTNLYSLTTLGVESEVLFRSGRWQGFVNASWVRRTDEEIRDPGIAPSPDTLTWEPRLRFKAGLVYQGIDWQGAISLLNQGSVARRATDVGSQEVPLTGTILDVDAYRSRSVGAWTTLQGKLSWFPAPQVEVALLGSNLLDQEVTLVKVQAFPFDYRGDRRKVSLLVRWSF